MAIDFSDLDEALECRAADPHRALMLANRHIAANPDEPHGYFSRHLTLSQLRRFDEALADCMHTIALAPRFWGYQSRGEVYRALGDHERALADFNRARNIDPGKAPGAADHWRARRRIDPDRSWQ